MCGLRLHICPSPIAWQAYTPLHSRALSNRGTPTDAEDTMTYRYNEDEGGPSAPLLPVLVLDAAASLPVKNGVLLVEFEEVGLGDRVGLEAPLPSEDVVAKLESMSEELVECDL